jgi:hypothetical protein
MPEDRLLASYRPTVRQLLGRTVLVGLVVGVAAVAAVIIVSLWGSRSPLVYLVFVPLVATGVFVVLTEVVRHGGVDATEHGLTRVAYRASVTRFVPWQQVLDIRTERQGWYTVVVIGQTSGARWRLPAPYDGRGLFRDPEFEPKVFYLRNLWETYRTGGPGRPDVAADPVRDPEPPGP